MKRYIPKFDELHFLDPKLAIKKERLVYYSKLFQFEDQEIQTIMNFKVWCKMNNHLLPECDEEILRHMHGCDSDSERAFASIKKK
jgi:hypothetical protein